ncbi:MAG: HAMP domain-containing histidine kinase [Desulfobacter sp.]|nr:MAG: HAMP domain-containing histidine kinase [Desulfobacter sp.]
MKIRRLYTKILVSFLGLLLVTIVLILVLFILTAGKSYKDLLDQQTFSKLQIVRSRVQETIDLHPDQPVTNNPDLLKLFNTFSSLFEVKIWITDPGETVLFKTFEGQTGMPVKGVHRQVHHENGITLYHFVLKWIKYYATIPIRSGKDELRLHLYYDTRHPDHPEGLFFMGILIIGGVVALLVVPMASLITLRINRLNRSAIEFADGNLAVRTHIQGHDEIAKLGDSFNHMAARLETLIHNAKELTANVSHELRSPLARLRVSKELIQDKLDQDGARADIQNLDTLVEEMLALSKMNYQESSLARETFSFAQFLDQEILSYQPLLQQNKLTLDLDVQGAVEVNQDKSVLKSVLSNLLDNAVKYTDSGKTIRVHARPGKKKGLKFSVTTPGKPLSKEDLDKLFNPFFRVSGQLAPGSGLGLTIAKKQVNRCQGKIQAQNTDQGLCLSVSLP